MRKLKINSKNLEEGIIKEDPVKLNAVSCNGVSCFLSDSNKIICLHLVTEINTIIDINYQTLSAYNENLETLDEIVLDTITDRNTNLFKSIHYKEEIGIFLYNSVNLIFKRFNGTKFERNNHTVFNINLGKDTVKSLPKNYTDIYKLYENKLIYVHSIFKSTDENFTIVALINVLELEKVIIRYFKIRLYKFYRLNIIHKIRLFTYNNYFCMAFGFSYEPKSGITNNTGFFFISYANYTEKKFDIIEQLFNNNDVRINNILIDLKDYVRIENNLFGFKYSEIKVLKKENCNNFNLIFSENNIIINPSSSIQKDDLIKIQFEDDNIYNKDKCQLVIKFYITDPDYDEYLKYPDYYENELLFDEATYNNHKVILEGKESDFNIELEEDLVTDCSQINCELCLKRNNSICITCKYNFTINNVAKNKICDEENKDSTEITDIMTETSDLNESITDITDMKDISDISDISSDNKTNIYDISSDIKSDITDIKDIFDINSDITDIEDISDINSDIKSDITDIEDKFDTNSDIITDIEDISDISSDIKSDISDISDINTDITDMKDISDMNNDIKSDITDMKDLSDIFDINSDIKSDITDMKDSSDLILSDINTEIKDLSSISDLSLNDINSDINDKNKQNTEINDNETNINILCDKEKLLNNKFNDEIMESEQIEEIFNNLKYFYLYCNNSDINIIFESKNAVFQISTLDFQLLNNSNNYSSVDLGICENVLRDKYNISKEYSLIIAKLDLINLNTSSIFVQYEVYNPITLRQLSLKICENLKIVLYSPVKINNSSVDLYERLKSYGYNLFDSNDPFYHDVCTLYTTEYGTDIIIEDRRKDYYQPNSNIILCQKDCEFVIYEKINSKSKCNRKIQLEEVQTDITKIKIDKEFLKNIFLDTIKNSNFRVIFCYKEAFNIKTLLQNYGRIIMTLILIIFWILMILYFVKEKKKIISQKHWIK